MARSLLWGGLVGLAVLGGCADEYGSTEDAAAAAAAETVTVTDVALFQSLAIPLFPEKEETGVPLIVGKDALVRVRIKGSDAAPKKVKAIVELGTKGKAIESKTISIGKSKDAELTVAVPGDRVTASTKIRVRITSADGKTAAGGWPEEGKFEKLTAEESGKLKIVFVPIQLAKSATYNLPKVDQPWLDDIRKSLVTMYPLSNANLEIEVRAPYVSQTTPSMLMNDTLVDEMIALHTADKAARDVRYVGLYDFDDLDPAFGIDLEAASDIYGGMAPQFTEEEVVTGIAEHPVAVVSAIHYRYGLAEQPADVDDDAGIAANATGHGCKLEDVQRFAKKERLVDALNLNVLHEVGHSLSLGHVNTKRYPFTVESGERDVTFPREEGSIGREAYDPSSGLFLAGTCFDDFMSYADYRWVSDHNYRRLHDILRGKMR